MDYVLNFEDFLFEGAITVKRKYTDAYPRKQVNEHAPIRDRVLDFVKERRTVTRSQLMEFIRGINEGNITSARKWITKNAGLFKIQERHSNKYYSLSKMGLRVQEATTKKNRSKVYE